MNKERGPTFAAGLLAASLLAYTPPSPPPPVDEGDTIKVDGKTFRLVGSDAPEIY